MPLRPGTRAGKWSTGAIQGDSEDDPEVAALGGESKKSYLGAPKSGHGGEFQLPLLWFEDSP